MPFSGMIKFKLLRIKITKKYILFFLHFRIKKKRKKDYTTQKHFNSEKEKEEKEEEKRKDNKKID